MLNDFLLQNQATILALTERKTLELAGEHPSSDQLKQGLPIFYRQIIEVIRRAAAPGSPPVKDKAAIASAADRGDEPAMAEAAGAPLEADLARSAGDHGREMLRLGYTLSHVVHAYGAMCQAITEIATEQEVAIGSSGFHALNRCLDVAIAGAVTNYDSFRKKSEESGKNDNRGVFTQMHNELMRAKVAFEAIQRGSVGVAGSTGQSLARCLFRLEALVDESLLDGGAKRLGSAH
jgi:hypothetical protein